MSCNNDYVTIILMLKNMHVGPLYCNYELRPYLTIKIESVHSSSESTYVMLKPTLPTTTDPCCRGKALHMVTTPDQSHRPRPRGSSSGTPREAILLVAASPTSLEFQPNHRSVMHIGGRVVGGLLSTSASPRAGL